jgi:hypothetical protein
MALYFVLGQVLLTIDWVTTSVKMGVHGTQSKRTVFVSLRFSTSSSFQLLCTHDSKNQEM